MNQADLVNNMLEGITAVSSVFSTIGNWKLPSNVFFFLSKQILPFKTSTMPSEELPTMRPSLKIPSLC